MNFYNIETINLNEKNKYIKYIISLQLYFYEMLIFIYCYFLFDNVY